MATLATIAPFGPDFDTPRLLALYRRLGCTSCQLYRARAEDVAPRTALRVVQSAGLRFDSLHALIGEDIDPSSADPDHRAWCLQMFQQEAELARFLGGDAVVIHPAAFNEGYVAMTADEARVAQEARWPHLDDFLPRLADLAERSQVTFLVENQPYTCPLGHDAVALADRIRRLDSSRVRMCFDTGHAHMTGDVAASLSECAPVIDYLHIHDNDGTRDDHRPPGEGTIDWSRFSRVLQETRCGATRALELYGGVNQLERAIGRGLGQRLARDLALR